MRHDRRASPQTPPERAGLTHGLRLLTAALVLCALCAPAEADRIKDLVSLGGIRDNQLVGYGLIVGLDGSGDQTNQAPFTTQSLKSMLSRLGVNLPDGVNPQTKNVAAVVLHATLPPFAKLGQTIDVNVSSIGNAKSLRGGTLILSPLKGADGQVYAMAQGNVVVPGLSVDAGGGNVTINIPSGGRVPNGATVEREVPTGFLLDRSLSLNLHNPDFTTVQRITSVINRSLAPGAARALDATTVEVMLPEVPEQRVAYVAALENLTVDPADGPAKVIVNSRTGTVIIGRNVRVTAAAVTHRNVTVTVRDLASVSQPGAFSGGETVVVPQSDIEVDQETNPMFVFDAGVSLDDIVKAVNEIGAHTDDLVAILEALKAAGALRAELIVI